VAPDQGGVCGMAAGANVREPNPRRRSVHVRVARWSGYEDLCRLLRLDLKWAAHTSAAVVAALVESGHLLEEERPLPADTSPALRNQREAVRRCRNDASSHWYVRWPHEYRYKPARVQRWVELYTDPQVRRLIDATLAAHVLEAM
jgi:hypothetical protein